MVKLKRRYLLVELLFADDQRVGVTGTDLYHAVVDKAANLHGDYGVGTLLGSFNVSSFFFF